MTWKHRLAALAAIPTLAAGLVAVTGAAASAHDATVHGSAVCDGGNAKITWTVTNDYNLTAVLSNATRVSSQLNGKTLAKAGQSGDTLTATETVTADGSTLTLTVHAKWTDGFQKDDSAAVKVPSKCQQPDVKDASASVTVTPGTCTEPGTAAYTTSHAHLVGSFSTSEGQHSATFAGDTGNPNHVFPDGASTKVITYVVPGKDHSLCPSVTPANPTVDQSVCLPHYGGPTQPTVTLPADDENYTYAVAYSNDGLTATVTATLVNPDANLGVAQGWTQTSDTTESITLQLHLAHCASKPKIAHLKAQPYGGCSPSHRWLTVLVREHIAKVTKTHNASRLRWVLRAHTRPGYVMHAGKHGHGPLVTHVRWVFHTHDTGPCAPQTS